MPPAKNKNAPSPVARAPKRDAGRTATAVSVDGNSLSAVSVSLQSGKVRVEGVEHHELDHLVEVKRRIRHPVYMDLDVSVFPGKHIIASFYEVLFSQSRFRHPAVAVLPSTRVQADSMEGEATATAALARRERLIEEHLPRNPMKYPLVFLFREYRKSPGLSVTRLASFRLADFFPMVKMIGNLGAESLGAIYASDALERVLRLLNPAGIDGSISLCNIGKLRTLYATSLANGGIDHNPIPVGLARAGTQYFTSFEPSAVGVRKLREQYGDLFPVSASNETPPPDDPLGEIGMFASQVARFAGRASKGSQAARGPLLVGGVGSHVPGLIDYLNRRTGGRVMHLEDSPSNPLRFADAISWSEVTDNILGLGAALEAIDPSPWALGPLRPEFHPTPLANGRCSVSEMGDGQLYVLEQSLE